MLPMLSVALALAMFYHWYSGRPGEAPPRVAKPLEIPAAVAEPAAIVEPDDAPAAAPDSEAAAATDPEPAPTDPPVRLSGWVRNQTGNALDGVRIELHSQGLDGEDPEILRRVSNPRGEFDFDGLVAGRSYRLEVKPGIDHAGYSVDSIVADASGSFHEITLEPLRLVSVDGMIVDTSDAPIPNFTFRLRSLIFEFPERIITSDSSGFFRLEDFPEGELRIATSNRDYYRIKGLELKADEYQTLKLVVDRGNYHLSGWVTDEFGTPLAEVRVTIKSAFSDDEYHSFSYRSTLTDSNGAFEFAELGGNRYTLGVYANGYESHIRNHEFLSFVETVEIRLTR